jgi:uncharacterized membrane protein
MAVLIAVVTMVTYYPSGHKCTYVGMQNASFFSVLIKIMFVAQILVILAIKFHKNLSRGSRVVPCGQMDRHDKANILF